MLVCVAFVERSVRCMQCVPVVWVTGRTGHSEGCRRLRGCAAHMYVMYIIIRLEPFLWSDISLSNQYVYSVYQWIFSKLASTSTRPDPDRQHNQEGHTLTHRATILTHEHSGFLFRRKAIGDALMVGIHSARLVDSRLRRALVAGAPQVVNPAQLAPVAGFHESDYLLVLGVLGIFLKGTQLVCNRYFTSDFLGIRALVNANILF